MCKKKSAPRRLGRGSAAPVHPGTRLRAARAPGGGAARSAAVTTLLEAPNGRQVFFVVSTVLNRHCSLF